jgi:hypothetical protein
VATSNKENPMITANTRRSKPGKGEQVRIFLVDETGADTDRDPADVLCTGMVEDFAADCQWPVVVKATPGLSPKNLARHLLYLASVIDRRETW